jgi:hypothetical protein
VSTVSSECGGLLLQRKNIELRVKTFDWIQGRLMRPAFLDYLNYGWISDARKEYNKMNNLYCAVRSMQVTLSG